MLSTVKICDTTHRICYLLAWNNRLELSQGLMIGNRTRGLKMLSHAFIVFFMMVWFGLTLFYSVYVL